MTTDTKAKQASKSELKRLCTQNPLEMARRIEELERRERMLVDVLNKFEYNEFGPKRFPSEKEVEQVLNATPAETAEHERARKKAVLM